MTMQCPDCKRFMRRIRDSAGPRDGGEYQCVNPICPFLTAEQKSMHEAFMAETDAGAREDEDQRGP